MTGFVIVTGITGAFFGFGIALGVLIVLALGRRDRRPGRKYQPFGRYDSRWSDGINRPGWDELSGPEDNDPPRWPGGPAA